LLLFRIIIENKQLQIIDTAGTCVRSLYFDGPFKLEHYFNGFHRIETLYSIKEDHQQRIESLREGYLIPSPGPIPKLPLFPSIPGCLHCNIDFLPTQVIVETDYLNQCYSVHIYKLSMNMQPTIHTGMKLIGNGHGVAATDVYFSEYKELVQEIASLERLTDDMIELAGYPVKW